MHVFYFGARNVLRLTRRVCFLPFAPLRRLISLLIPPHLTVNNRDLPKTPTNVTYEYGDTTKIEVENSRTISVAALAKLTPKEMTFEAGKKQYSVKFRFFFSFRRSRLCIVIFQLDVKQKKRSCDLACPLNVCSASFGWA